MFVAQCAWAHAVDGALGLGSPPRSEACLHRSATQTERINTRTPCTPSTSQVIPSVCSTVLFTGSRRCCSSSVTGPWPVASAATHTPANETLPVFCDGVGFRVGCLLSRRWREHQPRGSKPILTVNRSPPRPPNQKTPPTTHMASRPFRISFHLSSSSCLRVMSRCRHHQPPASQPGAPPSQGAHTPTPGGGPSLWGLVQPNGSRRSPGGVVWVCGLGVWFGCVVWVCGLGVWFGCVVWVMFGLLGAGRGAVISACWWQKQIERARQQAARTSKMARDRGATCLGMRAAPRRPLRAAQPCGRSRAAWCGAAG